MVALTGIEPAGCQFSSVQLGLSSCVFGSVQFATRAFRALRMADVLPRCCSAARIRLLRSAIPLRAGPAQPVGSGVGRLRRGAGTFCDEVGHLALLQPTFHRRVDGDVQTGFRYEYISFLPLTRRPSLSALNLSSAHRGAGFRAVDSYPGSPRGYRRPRDPASPSPSSASVR